MHADPYLKQEPYAVKATVEPLGPTRIKLNVEVPFDELRPALDSAYKRISRQVKVQGFRPGKVPPRIIDQRVGRASVLEEALQDAIPQHYAQAVDEQGLRVVSRPDVQLESFSDGEALVFSAEVDIRPEIELPDYDKLPVAVDDVVVTAEDVDQHLGTLQDRFAVLQTVEREVQDGDYVLLDISATIDGEALEGSDATGLSYEVGSGGLVDGLDDAIRGAAAGESRTFDADIKWGEHAGKAATFTVTPTAVKVKEVPDLDDDFAQTASEFDTIAELRDDVRTRLERIKRLEQAVQARDRVLEVLLARVDVPLPESMVEIETTWRRERIEQQLAQSGMALEDWLQANEQTEEELDTDLRTGASEAVKAQLVLDAIGAKEEIGVTEAELTDQVVRRAQRAGMRPDELAQRLVQQGQLNSMMAEIVRGKALALVLEQAEVKDASGVVVDLSQLRDDAAPAESAELEAAIEAAVQGGDDDDHDHEGHDHEGHQH